MNSPSPNGNFEPISLSDEDLAQIAVQPDSVSSNGNSSGHKSDSATVAAKPSAGKFLPPDFQPSNYDVICGRGKGCSSWIGNRRFRVTIAMNKERYIQAPTKVDKSLVVDQIVKTIKAASPDGGFIRKDAETGRWCKISTQQARDKVGHAMRDAVQADGGGKKTRRAKRRRSSRASTSDNQQSKQRKLAPVAMAMERTAATVAAAPVPMGVPSNPEVQPIQVSTSIRNSIRSSLRGSFRDAGFAAFILETLGGQTGDGANQEDAISLLSETALFRSLQDTAAAFV